MAEFFIVRNVYKAPVKRVFDYLTVESLKNPNNKQAEMLKDICDGIEFFNSERTADAKSKMKEGDYLYEVLYNGETNLICICPPKKVRV